MFQPDCVGDHEPISVTAEDNSQRLARMDVDAFRQLMPFLVVPIGIGRGHSLVCDQRIQRLIVQPHLIVRIRCSSTRVGVPVDSQAVNSASQLVETPLSIAVRSWTRGIEHGVAVPARIRISLCPWAGEGKQPVAIVCDQDIPHVRDDWNRKHWLVGGIQELDVPFV